MNNRTILRVTLIWLPLLLALAACGTGGSTEASPTQSATAPTQQSNTNAATNNSSSQIRQWASRAEASSEYSSEDFSASQATGASNTPDCGDASTAWASLNQDTKETLNLYFAQPVYATQINVVESYYPDQVAQVDLIDMEGKFITVYTGEPQWLESSCPYTLSISVNKDDVLAQGVRLTVDQTIVQNWNEIDAVEIVGTPGE